MNPKVSVVIPAYNGERFISKTIESVLSQSYPAHEIIVVDDGSTDSTPRIVRSFKDKIISRRIKNSGGPSVPRNAAMVLSTGDYIAFLDQDDLWYKDKLKKQAELIIRYPDAGLFCGNYAVRRNDENFKLKKHFSLLCCLGQMNFDAPLKTDPFRLLIKENFVGGPSTVIIKKDIIKKVGEFDSGLVYSEDYDYWLRCAAITDFVVISSLLAYKRAHGANLLKDAVRWHIDRGNVLRKVMRNNSSYIKAHGLLGEYQQALAKNHYKLGNSYFETGKIQQAFSIYLRGLSCSRTFKNLIFFMQVISRKLIRFLTFGILRRENLKCLTKERRES